MWSEWQEIYERILDEMFWSEPANDDGDDMEYFKAA